MGADAQPGGAPSPLACAGDVPCERGFPSAAAALAGAGSSLCSLKGNKASSPNQDRAVCASLCGGAAELFSIMDGHGQDGHSVAELVKDVLPRLLLRNISRAAAGPAILGEQHAVADFCRSGAALAFDEMHLLLEVLTQRLLESADAEIASGGPFLLVDSRCSGTTATAALLLQGQRLLLAHVGDSRAVLGVRARDPGAPWRALDLTRDHRPDAPDERARIEGAGAQVVTVGIAPVSTNRVITQGQSWPAINMSRSLGDLHAHSQGLTCAAEVALLEAAWDPATEEAMLLLGSDGIWDVLEPQVAVDIAAHVAQQGGEPAAVLAREAYERWGRRGLVAGYSDDITVIVKVL